jgi:sterol O-acyltransferase
MFGNRNVAMIVTFLLSAIVHEYILIVTFHFFFPALFIMFFGIGGEQPLIESSIDC